MLYLTTASQPRNNELQQTIESALPARNDIAVRATLPSRCRHVFDTPWACLALYDTATCRRMYGELQPDAEISGTVAHAGSDPVGGAGIAAGLTKFVSAAAAFGHGLTTCFSGKSKDYYEFYMRRIANELALRGIPEGQILPGRR